MIVAGHIGEKGRAIAAGGDQSERAHVGVTVGDDAGMIGIGRKGKSSGGDGDKAIGAVSDTAGYGDGIDAAKIVTALVPGGKIEEELTAGDDGADLWIGTAEGKQSGGEAGAEVGGAEIDSLTHFMICRRRKYARSGLFTGQIGPENQAAHRMNDNIDLGRVDGGNARAESSSEGFKSRAGGAGGDGDCTVIEENHFAAEVAETLGELAKRAFGGDGVARRELKTVDEDDGLGEGGEREE